MIADSFQFRNDIGEGDAGKRFACTFHQTVYVMTDQFGLLQIDAGFDLVQFIEPGVTFLGEYIQ